MTNEATVKSETLVMTFMEIAGLVDRILKPVKVPDRDIKRDIKELLTKNPHAPHITYYDQPIHIRNGEKYSLNKERHETIYIGEPITEGQLRARISIINHTTPQGSFPKSDRDCHFMNEAHSILESMKHFKQPYAVLHRSGSISLIYQNRPSKIANEAGEILMEIPQNTTTAKPTTPEVT